MVTHALGRGDPPPLGVVTYPPPEGVVTYPPPEGVVTYPPPEGAVTYPPPEGVVTYLCCWVVPSSPLTNTSGGQAGP